MDINIDCAEVIVQLAANMGGDLMLAVRAQEALGFQKNQVLLSQLVAFETLVNNVYEICRPSPEEYANRRELVRIFNEIAREMYGGNDSCPVVENFGSFLMDMFNAKSDLDLSINFSDKLFEDDRVSKIKTLRKFAKKFYNLRRKGLVTTVELILSARVPVLKILDTRFGIECDFSVGNRDGIAKSHIVHLISAIDERFQKLSFMMKAWAKAHDINSSKDGTLNSISIILLAAFHLQTRDVPILPPFSAIFRDGMDPVAVKRIIPSFLNYGKRNKESLAELFVSLLVKLQSVETYWSKGLCASTYEGSWIFVNWKASGYIKIEDFTDRSQNTARAVKSAKMNKIYACIRRSLERIQSFTEGKIGGVIKNQLFGPVPPRRRTVIGIIHEPVSSVTAEVKGKQAKHIPGSTEAPTPLMTDMVKKVKKVKKKRSAMEGPAELQGKQDEHIPCSAEAPTPSMTDRVKKVKKKHSTMGGPAEVQEKQDKHIPCSTEAPTPSMTDRVKKVKKSKKVKKKSMTGKITDSKTPNSVPALSFQGLDRLQRTVTESSLPQGFGGFALQRTGIEAMNYAAPTFQVGQPDSNFLNQGSGEFRSQRTNVGNLNHGASTFPVNQQYSHSNQQPIQQHGGFGLQRTHVDTLSHAASKFSQAQPLAFSTQYFQDSGGFRPALTHVETSRHVAPNGLPYQLPSVSGYGVFRPERTHVETLEHAASSFSSDQPLHHSNHLHSQGYGGFRSERTHVETLRHAPSNFPAGPPLLHSGYNPPIQGSGGFRSERIHVETLRHAPPNVPAGPPSSHSVYNPQGSGAFRSERTHVETLKHAPPNVPAGPPMSYPVYNPPIQGSGSFVPERMHAETLSYSASKRQPAGFGSERNQADNYYHATSQMPHPYTLSSRPGSFMPPYQPYLPTVSHRNPAELHRSHDLRQSSPSVPSQFAANMRPYQ